MASAEAGTLSDNRVSNNLSYSTPVVTGGLKTIADYVLSEDEVVDNGMSASISYATDDLSDDNYYGIGAILKFQREALFLSVQIGKFSHA